jgi:hypothetical protein
LGDSSYHFKQLAKFRVAKVTRVEKRRGAVEHFYELTAVRSDATLVVLDVLDGRAELVSAEDAESPDTAVDGVSPVV